VDGLPGVLQFVMEDCQNLNNILANVDRAGASISRENANWCWNGVRIVGSICGEAGRWLQASTVNKLWNWPRCKTCTKWRAFGVTLHIVLNMDRRVGNG